MRGARWRQQPATESQKIFIKSHWNKVPKYVRDEMAHDTAGGHRIQDLTKGKAANIITHIKRGDMVFIPRVRPISGGTNLRIRVDTSTR